MKKILLPLASLTLVAVFIFSSCKKKDDTPATSPSTTTGGNNTNTTTPSASAATPAMANDANALLVALRLNTYVSYSVTGYGLLTTAIHADAGVAEFPTTAGGGTFQAAGTVSLNATGLDLQSNN
ncbi:MAG: hypothetical protein ACXVPQ_08670, partial [Bacteroidia bacterium]